ncbi:OVARIAN TUMOR DOMAIN-containing deubiquitinating enzyme 6-like [Populus alba x Populus x berolinensis]|uniref:OVARIAN TUMOR DOMAIN-containing deubiquitinating enzyme 6-like n=1 Tax=Populus alba x Populus x berolinensis TaxID=444605 RepID=A0AAD6R3Y7_9ROSI|nr:OVARIAN TUMOR DOMAIN-containing deubiquitinating enzyme 6-like [Populus alba x Populus x berolinensis]
MTRILVQRGSGSSSNQSRAGSSSSAARPDTQGTSTLQAVSTPKDEDVGEEVQEQVVVDEFLENSGSHDNKVVKSDELLMGSINGDRSDSLNDEIVDNDKVGNEEGVGSGDSVKGLGGLILERSPVESEGSSSDCPENGSGSPQPPPPPVPPPKPDLTNSNSRRFISGTSNSVRIGSSRRAVAWPVVSTRSSPTGSRPSSPRSHGENEGYNSADEQNPCFVSSYDDFERERQFEIDIRRSKGLEVKRMLEDGNCLFRAVTDQVYGDSEMYDLARQMCVDYMERERDHFSQFITEGFTSYCKRKRRDKVYGNNVEIQALSEMYNRPIHIYSYSTEPINIGSYNTDTPPIQLSYHHGNHYNSLVNPRRSTIGAGLGFSCLQGASVDRDQVKAAIKAQQDQQIDNASIFNALLAEGQFYSDLEVTEKEIERMVMEASRAEYLSDNKFKPQLGRKGSSTSGAEPSSSGARSSSASETTKVEGAREHGLQDTVLSSSMQIVLSMGFSYLQAIEAYSIFGDDVDSMVCYLVETSSSSSSRRKGKATE